MRLYRSCLEKGFILREQFCQNPECKECKEFKDKFEQAFSQAPKHGDGIVQKVLNANKEAIRKYNIGLLDMKEELKMEQTLIEQEKTTKNNRIIISDFNTIKDDESKRRIDELELQKQGNKVVRRFAKRSFWVYLRDILFKW